MALLDISNLSVKVQTKSIVCNCNFSLNFGNVKALMGPNGSGKSTLALTIMGHPFYSIEKGTIMFEGEDITHLSTEKRAKRGIFLAFQQPFEIPGVRIVTFLKESYQAVTGKTISVSEFHALLKQKMAILSIDPLLVTRNLNEGFSGGEKKRFELLQALLLKPKLLLLDEIDSGLDVDALRLVGEGVQSLRKECPKMGILLITHYPRILRYIVPDQVHVMSKGSIIESGTIQLAYEVEQKGYENIVPV